MARNNEISYFNEKQRDAYDDIFGKKPQFRYSKIDKEAIKPRYKKSKKHGKIPVENITVYK